MNEEDLMKLAAGERLPYRTAEEMIAFLAETLDIEALPLELVPEWQLTRMGKEAETTLINQKLHYTMADFHYSLFRIVPNEKSAIFYKAHHIEDEIHVLIEHKTNTYFTDSSLLFAVLDIERGISEEEVQENGMRYLAYCSYFHALEEKLQQMKLFREHLLHFDFGGIK